MGQDLSCLKKQKKKTHHDESVEFSWRSVSEIFNVFNGKLKELWQTRLQCGQCFVQFQELRVLIAQLVQISNFGSVDIGGYS